MPKKSDISAEESSGIVRHAAEPEVAGSRRKARSGRAAEPEVGTKSATTGRNMKGLSRAATQPDAEGAPEKGMKAAPAEETRDYSQKSLAKKAEAAPGKSRVRPASAEQKTEKTLAKKGTLGKIAKAVTKQVSAIARKVSGKQEETKAPKSRGRKAVADQSSASAQAVTTPPSSRSGRSAVREGEEKAAPGPTAGQDATPRVSAASKGKGAGETKGRASASRSGAATTGSDRETSQTVTSATVAAPKKTVSRRSRKAVEAGEPQVEAADAGELIPAEQDIQTPSPSDVREQIFHERYAHVPPPPPRDLPSEYGDTRIVLLVRDPEWIYAYWEVNDSTRQELRIPRSGHNRRMVIRLYKITGRNWPEEAAHYFFDVEVSPYAQNWYIKLPETAQKWCAELGMFNEEGEYLPIVRSNVIATPRDTVSPETDADWMTVEEVYEKLYGISAGYAAANAVLRGAAGRGASEQLLRHLQRQIAAGLRGQIDLSSGGLYSGASESVTNRGRGVAGKDFWLQVHTELILYGSTEPDARVTVQGRPVKLNPDGTFSLRYALPDGEQVLRVHAVNRDGDMEREVTPVVTRTTRKKG